MRRTRTTIAGILMSIALLGGTAGVVLAAVGTAAPTHATAATAIEYGL
jgi:hypothetical protein